MLASAISQSTGELAFPLNFNMTLNLRFDDRVTGAKIVLPSSLRSAVTSADFDNTGFYELAMVMLGHRCSNLTRQELYKTLYGQIGGEKPTRVTRLGRGSEQMIVGIWPRHVICGHSYVYSEDHFPSGSGPEALYLVDF